MMTTLCIQELPIDWIRPTARQVQRSGIVASSRFPLRFPPSSQIGGRVLRRRVDPSPQVQLYFWTKVALPGGKRKHGSALSHREVCPAAGSYAGVAAAGNFRDCGGAREAARSRKGPERRAVEYALS